MPGMRLRPAEDCGRIYLGSAVAVWKLLLVGHDWLGLCLLRLWTLVCFILEIRYGRYMWGGERYGYDGCGCSRKTAYARCSVG